MRRTSWNNKWLLEAASGIGRCRCGKRIVSVAWDVKWGAGVMTCEDGHVNLPPDPPSDPPVNVVVWTT